MGVRGQVPSMATRARAIHPVLISWGSDGLPGDDVVIRQSVGFVTDDIRARVLADIEQVNSVPGLKAGAGINHPVAFHA